MFLFPCLCTQHQEPTLFLRTLFRLKTAFFIPMSVNSAPNHFCFTSVRDVFLRAREDPYALHPVAQRYPQRGNPFPMTTLFSDYFSFSSVWYLCAWKNPCALHLVALMLLEEWFHSVFARACERVCVCVCVCVRARARVCVCVCVSEPGTERAIQLCKCTFVMFVSYTSLRASGMYYRGMQLTRYAFLLLLLFSSSIA